MNDRTKVECCCYWKHKALDLTFPAEHHLVALDLWTTLVWYLQYLFEEIKEMCAVAPLEKVSSEGVQEHHR